MNRRAGRSAAAKEKHLQATHKQHASCTQATFRSRSDPKKRSRFSARLDRQRESTPRIEAAPLKHRTRHRPLRAASASATRTLREALRSTCEAEPGGGLPARSTFRQIRGKPCRRMACKAARRQPASRSQASGRLAAGSQSNPQPNPRPPGCASFQRVRGRPNS